VIFSAMNSADERGSELLVAAAVDLRDARYGADRVHLAGPDLVTPFG